MDVQGEEIFVMVMPVRGYLCLIQIKRRLKLKLRVRDVFCLQANISILLSVAR